MVADTVVTAVPVQTAVRTVSDAVPTRITVNSTEVVSLRTHSAAEFRVVEGVEQGIVLTVLAESGDFGAESAANVDSIKEVAILALAVGAVGIGFPVAPLNLINFHIVN